MADSVGDFSQLAVIRSNLGSSLRRANDCGREKHLRRPHGVAAERHSYNDGRRGS